MEIIQLTAFLRRIPLGNVGRHCATPKRVTIGIKISSFTPHMMYTRTTINGCDRKKLSKKDKP